MFINTIYKNKLIILHYYGIYYSLIHLTDLNVKVSFANISILAPKTLNVGTS